MQTNDYLITAEREVYSVSALNQAARLLLEGHFPLVWVEGEISNLARPASGHIYFSLKDAKAQTRCAMFRMRNSVLPFTPKDGMQVLVRARVSLYEGRGDFQLIVEHMEAAGDGALLRAFEALKAKLKAQGLFAEAHKQALPTIPKSIGIITSPTGAAIRDVLSVLKRRFPAVPVVIYPVQVQGKTAGTTIAKAIQVANELKHADVLILTRGGGSLEDLWAFNEEVVAHAIFDSQIPIISGVGHEVDFTIADFVADCRAPTPSAAAELIVPDQRAIWQEFVTLLSRAKNILLKALHLHQQNLIHMQKHLQHPATRLLQQSQTIDLLEQQLRSAIQQKLYQSRQLLLTGAGRLEKQNPANRIQQFEAQLIALTHTLNSAFSHHVIGKQTQLKEVVRALHTVSPLATLGRGYSILRDTRKTIVTHSQQVKVGDTIDATLANGTLHCQVLATTKE